MLMEKTGESLDKVTMGNGMEALFHQLEIDHQESSFSKKDSLFLNAVLQYKGMTLCIL